MRRLLALSTSLLFACASNVVDEGGGETSGSSSTGSDPATTSTPTPTTTGTVPPMTSSGEATSGSDDGTTSGISWETEGADEGYATTSGCGFTCPQPGGGGPGGGSLECSIAEQDCPDGEKCAPWANDGGTTWNATRCVPLDVTPEDIGAECLFEGSHVSGIDSCDVGLWCGPDAESDGKTKSGTCHQLCSAGPCPAGTQCFFPFPGVADLGVCQQPCDPLGAPCPDEEACHPSGFEFTCHMAGAGVETDPCDAGSACAPGLVCVEAPQCDDEFTDSCCVPYCDLSAPDCPEGQSCVDYGSPLPEFEDVGYCAG